MNKCSFFLAVTFFCVAVGAAPAFALIPNGDFETGDLSGYYVQKRGVDVDFFPTVRNVDDGTGNRVGEVASGAYLESERIITLGKNFGALPSDVQDLFFDVKLFDLGPEDQGSLNLAQSPVLNPLASTSTTDYLYAVFVADGQNENLFILDTQTFRNRNPFLVSYQELDNGFLRVKANISQYAGSQNAKLNLYMNNTDDHINSKFQVDNIDLTSSNQAVAPEPSTIFLLGGGLAGMFWRKRNRKKF